MCQMSSISSIGEVAMKECGAEESGRGLSWALCECA